MRASSSAAVKLTYDDFVLFPARVHRFGRPFELLREVGEVLTTPLLPGLDIPRARMVRR